MCRNRKPGDVIMKEDDKVILSSIAKSQTEEYCKVQRAKIILLASEGLSNTEISLKLESKETMAFLETRPGRFVFAFTPKHGSWLNLIESFFGKITTLFVYGWVTKSQIAWQAHDLDILTLILFYYNSHVALCNVRIIIKML